MKKQVLDACLNKQIKCKDGAKLLQMHPKSFSRLKSRYVQEGEDVLMPKKTGPKKFTPPNRTPSWFTDLVVNLAKKHPDLGPVPLAGELWDKHKIILHSTTIWRILKREKVRYTREYKRWKQEPKMYCLDVP